MVEKTTGFARLVLKATLATIAAETSKTLKTTAMCYVGRDEFDRIKVIKLTEQERNEVQFR